MGAGVSAGFPDKLTEDQCRALTGTAFDLIKFNTIADKDGLVKKQEILDMANDDDQDIHNVAETVQRNGIFFSFEDFDADHSGGLTYDEFYEASKHLGFSILPENLKAKCAEIDTDNSGVIDSEEFVRFIKSEVKIVPELPEGVDPKAPGVIYDHIGNVGAQYGYSAAMAIIAARPSAAADRLQGEGYKGSAWYPLHYILTMTMGGRGDDGAAAAAARRLIAEDIVCQITKAYMPSCSQRIMEGLKFPRGHLPLELAITRGWSTTVIQAIIHAYPEALEALDPVTDKDEKKQEELRKAKAPITSLKGLRFMRKIAEDAGRDDDILVLLPKPKVADGKVQWQSGKEVADALAEKERKKQEKERKKQEKLAKKRQKEAEKAEKARLKAQAEDTKAAATVA